MIPSLYASTAKKKDYRSIFTTFWTLFTVLILVIGSIGYLANGDLTQEVVILNLSHGKITMVI